MGTDGDQIQRAISGRRPLMKARHANPLREERVSTYRRLMDAEARLDGIRQRHGIPETVIADVLDAIEGGGDRIEPTDDLYLRTVSRYVAQLGGHLEVIAVFPDGTITLVREPDPAGG
jgi:hypothetical protein